MADKTKKAAKCLTEACRAAKRKDSANLDRHLKELNKMKLKMQTVESKLPRWLRDVIKDQGLRLGKDIILKKGPGTVGVEFEIRW